jgi:hypothetical protein
MALRHAYAPELPEMDPFLFAFVGEEIEGIPLTVLSALSRLDVDPRREAARLSHLARDAAIDQLARMIDRLPDRHWTSLEIRRMATKLVELLPPTDEDRENAQPSGSADRTISPRASHFLIYLALAGAVLIGLITNGSLSISRNRKFEFSSLQRRVCVSRGRGLCRSRRSGLLVRRWQRWSL